LQSATARQPHMFDRNRPARQRGFPPRESSILPRSNPFSNPRPRLVDSLAPAVRFLTLVVLFTAAGLWVQMISRHETKPVPTIESPRTAAQPAVAPANNALDRTVPGPTATGPIESHPEPGARVGSIEANDFASHDNSSAGPVPAARPMVTPPHFLISAGSHVPRVRVAESNSRADSTASPNDESNRDSNAPAESDEEPAVARYPGFLLDVPTR
jgi:hypothetical protein